MQCPNCQATLEHDTIYCGNCGKQVAPLRARGATLDYSISEINNGRNATQKQVTPHVTATFPAPFVHRNAKNASSTLLSPSTRRRSRRPARALLAVVLLILFAGGTVLAIALLKNSPVTNASGQVVFFDGTNGSSGTDALRITANNLDTAPSGSHYDAWLVDEVAEHTTFLGSLTANGSTFTLNFAGNGSNGQPGTNLLSRGNVVEITQEQGRAQLPAGKVVLAARFPPAAFVHIKHLLFSFPTTPRKIGLLVGLLEQTRLLNAQALALQSIANNQDIVAIKCVAQSIIDISEGQQGGHFQPLSAVCGASIPSGDGFGILGTNGYAQTAATHASLAATQTDTTATIRLHASEVETGTTNITGWVTTIDQDAFKLLNNPANQTGIQDIVTLADHAFHGVDSNGNGQIEPVTGEEGAATTYLRGQLMATLTLVP